MRTEVQDAEVKHDEVVLDIVTPKGPFEGAFPKTTTIAKVIEVVVAEKHLDSRDAFELVHRNTVLNPIDSALASFGLHGTVHLELTEVRHDEVVLDIATPKGLFKGAFPKTTTIAKVIAVVVAEKHLDSKDKFELVHGETVLKPEDRTLESFGLHGVVQLELVATGSGV